MPLSHTRIHTQTHAHTYTHTLTCIYIHTHTHTQQTLTHLHTGSILAKPKAPHLVNPLYFLSQRATALQNTATAPSNSDACPLATYHNVAKHCHTLQWHLVRVNPRHVLLQRATALKHCAAQHTATRCNTLQQRLVNLIMFFLNVRQRCNRLQHTHHAAIAPSQAESCPLSTCHSVATVCNTLNTPIVNSQPKSCPLSTCHSVAAHCNTLQHTTPHCNTLQQHT